MLERKGWKPRKNSLPTGSFWNCLQQKCPQGALFSTVQTSKWPWDINMLIPPPFPPQPGKPRVRMAVLHGETEEGKMSHWKNWECTPNTLPLKPIANISHQRYFPLASASRPAKPLCLRQTVSSLGIRGTGSPRWIIKSTVSRSLQFKTSSLGWPLLNSQGLAASGMPSLQCPKYLHPFNVWILSLSPMEKRLLETQTPCGGDWCQVVWGPLPREAGSIASLVTMP